MKRNTATRKTVRNPTVTTGAQVPQSQEYNWAEYFALTEHWQSDLIFFEDEMRFFRNLMDRYFMAFIEKENFDKTRLMAVGLTDLDNERTQLQKNASSHLIHLGALIENPFSHDAQVVLGEHQKTETAMTDFVRQFRSVKKDIFKLTEHVMESKKASHLLGA